MHNDIALNVSENTLIAKPLTASKIPRCRFLVFQTNLDFVSFNANRNSTNQRHSDQQYEKITLESQQHHTGIKPKLRQYRISVA